MESRRVYRLPTCAYFFLKNGKFSRYRYIPGCFSTQQNDHPRRVRQKDRFREVRAFASLAELEGAAAVDRQRAQSAWRRKLLMLAWRRETTPSSTVWGWIFFKAWPKIIPKWKEFLQKTCWFLGFEVWGRLQGAPFFFSGTPKKLGRNMKNC